MRLTTVISALAGALTRPRAKTAGPRPGPATATRRAAPTPSPPARRAPATVVPGAISDYRGGATPRFVYAPENDGDPDPGEVVWGWVPYEEDASQGKDRPVLIVGLLEGRLLGIQLTSKDHGTGRSNGRRDGREWLDVGTGGWDSQRRPSEVRLDRLLLVDPSGVRREGAALSRARYDEVVAALKELHGW